MFNKDTLVNQFHFCVLWVGDKILHSSFHLSCIFTVHALFAYKQKRSFLKEVYFVFVLVLRDDCGKQDGTEQFSYLGFHCCIALTLHFLFLTAHFQFIGG